MDDSVYIPIDIDMGEIAEAEELPSKTYRLDLDAGRITGCVDELESVNQAIRKAIITPRFKCLIYDDQYGSNIEEAIAANDATPEYIEAVIENFVKDALLPDTRILEVYDFAFRFEEDKAFVSFKADTIFGETEIEEVI